MRIYLISRVLNYIERFIWKNFLLIITYLILIIASIIFGTFSYFNETNNFFNSIFSAFVTVLILLTIFLMEKQRQRKFDAENQRELIINFIYEVKENMAHIVGIKNNFIKNDFILIKKKIESDKKLENKVKNKLLSLWNNYNHKFKCNKYNVLKDFIQEWDKLNNKFQDIEFNDFFVIRFLTFNLQKDTIGELFSNLKLFEGIKFRELRKKFITLKHYYEVYYTNINMVLNNASFLDTKYPAIKKIYYNSVKCNLMFCDEFRKVVKGIIKELCKDKQIKKFIIKNKDMIQFKELLEEKSSK